MQGMQGPTGARISPGPRTTLDSLPPEILQQIHLLAQNHNLHRVSTTTHAFLSPPYTSSYYIATYLLDLYRDQAPHRILTKALQHGNCTVQVAKDIKRIWDKRRGYSEPPRQSIVAEPSVQKSSSIENTIPIPITPPPRPTKPALKVSELPRRIFRNLTPTTPVPPLLIYLFETYAPNPNSFEGYALTRAVLAKNLQIVKYLLSKGADPGMKDGLAISAAVKFGDLQTVRMLVEHQNLTFGAGQENKEGVNMDISSRWVETAVKSGSDEIVSYFVHEKGVMPPLHSIMRLGQISSGSKRKLDDVSPSRKREDSKRTHEERDRKRRTMTRGTKDKPKPRAKSIKTLTNT